VLLLVTGVALLALGIIEGTHWGWESMRVVGSLTAAAVSLVAFAMRSSRHPAPVVEPGLFRVRSFAFANAGVFLFALGFYALLLANILFLTGVWGWSLVRAGVAVTPGPIMAALFSVIGGRTADRFGQRVVAIPGGLLFASGCLLFAHATGVEPRYLTEYLPSTLMTGAGVGLSFAAWSSAAVAELPHSRFATGSAVAQTSRQIGAVLGIAILVAVIGTPAPGDALDTFHSAWVLMALPAVSAALLALGLGRVRARDPEAAMVVASEA
jgi:MFS family permease